MEQGAGSKSTQQRQGIHATKRLSTSDMNHGELGTYVIVDAKPDHEGEGDDGAAANEGEMVVMKGGTKATKGMAS